MGNKGMHMPHCYVRDWIVVLGRVDCWGHLLHIVMFKAMTLGVNVDNIEKLRKIKKIVRAKPADNII